ncbi:MAG TPA: V-type ATP synthase subunit F [Caldisericia bacterium]|nr:V-type ATP synthase subunit F [Caldisericia bacterium]HPI84588.1 V-type ATP synthase subunit F [Caldisericia bacterium]HPQ92997.1 V-type ATP synthase subunit F [Caldisericia bacterium]
MQTDNPAKRLDVVAFGNSLQVSPWGYMGAKVITTDDIDAESTLKRLLSDKNIGILLISEEVAKAYEEILSISGLTGPVVLVLPSGFDEVDPAWKTLRKLVTEAVGVDLLGKE